jgi:hypothetical protein
MIKRACHEATVLKIKAPPLVGHDLLDVGFLEGLLFAVCPFD